MTKCPNPDCNNTSFKAEEISVRGLNHYVYAVACSSCNTAIGVLPVGLFVNQNEVIEGIAKKVGVSTPYLAT